MLTMQPGLILLEGSRDGSTAMANVSIRIETKIHKISPEGASHFGVAISPPEGAIQFGPHHPAQPTLLMRQRCKFDQEISQAAAVTLPSKLKFESHNSGCVNNISVLLAVCTVGPCVRRTKQIQEVSLIQ